MKMNKKIIIVFVCVLFVFGCTQKEKFEEKQDNKPRYNKYSLFQEYISKYTKIDLNKTKKFILLNENSCHGCVSFVSSKIAADHNNFNDSIKVILVYNSSNLPDIFLPIVSNYNEAIIDSNDAFNQVDIAPFQSVVISLDNKSKQLQITDIVDYYHIY
jgi:hypothetical protein